MTKFRELTHLENFSIFSRFVITHFYWIDFPMMIAKILPKLPACRKDWLFISFPEILILNSINEGTLQIFILRFFFFAFSKTFFYKQWISTKSFRVVCTTHLPFYGSFLARRLGNKKKNADFPCTMYNTSTSTQLSYVSIFQTS